MVNEDNSVTEFPDVPVDNDLSQTVTDTSQYQVPMETGEALPSETESEVTTDSEAPSETQASDGITYEELATKKGFKSADDLAKAYQNLESQNKRVEMDRTELLKARQESKHTTEQTQPQRVEQRRNVPSSNQVYRMNPDLEQKLKRIDEVAERIEINELFQKYDDAAQYANKMSSFIKNRPHASWEEAYRFVKFEDLASKAKKEGREEAYNIIDRKERSAVERPTTLQTKPNRSIDEMIADKNTPLSEIEKLLVQ